jgi:nucleoside-diphosphate kinase
MAAESTLVVIKPDAIQRGLTGLALSRLEHLRLHIIGAKAMRVSREMAKEHYHHLQEKAFFDELLDHLTGKLHGTSYVLAFVFWGPDAINRVREVTGATHPEKADPMSLRGAFGRMTTTGIMENILHASADRSEAEREILLWFKPQELLSPPVVPAVRV